MQHYQKTQIKQRNAEALAFWLTTQNEDLKKRGVTHFYALVNSAILTQEQQEKIHRICIPNGEINNLYDDMEGLELAKSGPHLLEVAQTPMAMKALADLSCAAWAVSLMWSAQGQSVLLAHLRQLREARLGQDTQVLFRFQDTAVLTALWPLTTQALADTLLGPVFLWAVLDACTNVNVLVHRPTSMAQAGWALDEDIQTALDQALQVQNIRTQVNEIDEELLAPYSLCAQYEKLEKYQKESQENGLTNLNDIALYVILAMQLPKDFVKHEPFKTALSHSTTTQPKFGEALDAITDEQWIPWNQFLNKDR